jgi:hypothetical protein
MFLTVQIDICMLQLLACSFAERNTKALFELSCCHPMEEIQ